MSAKHFLSLLDLSPAELAGLIARATQLKKLRSEGVLPQPLKNLVLGMIFEKASTRTRVSFSVGMVQLGGQALFLSPADTQLGRGEPLADSAIVMSSMLDGLMIRTFAHDTLREFAAHSKVPVINGLSDELHPCQLLADMQTYAEQRGAIAGKTVAWIGDGNNMCNSYLEAAVQFDFKLRIACPPGYEPDARYLALAGERATLLRDPLEAVQGAHLVTTDTWASMGQEDETAQREEAFRAYQVDAKLLGAADKDVLFLHCLPAYRGKEISEDLLDDPRSAVWQQAENRLHAQKALLEKLIAPSAISSSL